MNRSQLVVITTLVGLSIAVMLLGGRHTSPTSPIPGPQVKDRDQQLSLSCAHAVIDPDCIRGVIVVTNIGGKRLSLIQRWTSWGCRQWVITIDGAAYGLNEIPIEYTAMPPLTAELDPGESRAVPFIVPRTGDIHVQSPSPNAWIFTGNCSHRGDDGKLVQAIPPSAFPHAPSLILGFAGHPLGPATDTDVAPSIPAAVIIREFRDPRSRPVLPPLWVGNLSVVSEMVSPAESDARCRGAAGRTISDDL